MEDGGAWASTWAWTPLSVPLAAVYGPCLDAVAEELAAGRGLVSAVFGQGPLAVAARRDPPTTDFLSLFPLSPPYFTPWQLPHLLLFPASLREAKLCSIIILHIPSKTVDQTLPN